MKILIVEDEVPIREGMSDYLMECGYEVLKQAMGGRPWTSFTEKPDLVLLDIQLPILNGLEVLKTIRKTSSVPVLMLTAFHDEDYKLFSLWSWQILYLGKTLLLVPLEGPYRSYFHKSFSTSRVFTLWRGTGGF